MMICVLERRLNVPCIVYRSAEARQDLPHPCLLQQIKSVCRARFLCNARCAYLIFPKADQAE
jgi:hypothetical protein